MNSKQLFQDFLSKITRTERDEANAIGYLVFESLFGLSKTEIISGKSISTPEADKKLKKIAARVNCGEPVQYVLGEADFYSRKFVVTPDVLIPRPETEELVLQVIQFCNDKKISAPRILDIGTGSGCIPITLSLELPESKVIATDISESALNVARQNASKHKADVKFLTHDILSESLSADDLDIITSNPPYIAASEKSTMSENVVHHEPHLALFVPDNDPLVFYRALAFKSKSVLKPGGLLIVEINERFGTEVMEIFLENGFTDAAIVKDVVGKNRMVKGEKPR